MNNTQTCSISVPTGHIIVNSRWQGGSDLTKHLQSSIPVHFESSTSVIDFHPASNAGVIYIFEADIIDGHAYKKRAARLRKANRVRGVVLAEKTDMSSQYFPSLQKFCVSDLGLNLVPVANQLEAADFLVQMVYNAESSHQKNPFLATRPRPQSNDVALLNTLSSLPGVGETKARALLDKFPNVLMLCQASQQDLTEVVGKASSIKLHNFLHGVS